MIFETLIFRCLIHGTSFTDAGKTISLKKVMPGEKVLFFKIDDDTKKECLSISGDCCDSLIYYSDSNNRRILCLAELKGKDTEQAARQIISTYDSLVLALGHSKKSWRTHSFECSDCKSHFNTCEACRTILDKFTWKAFIHQRGSSPNQLGSDLVQELYKRFGKHGLGYDLSHVEDIGYLLRK
ncbi:MAG TPA: hypothetical protein VJO32_14900 [Ktedonobacteraceae bacterium]|nr:hypothetical protein [Ktedonobacteraceae bacterium]